jgi:hypothetical protein
MNKEQGMMNDEVGVRNSSFHSLFYIPCSLFIIR